MANRTRLREEGAEYADYRSGLSPERSANCVCRSRNWRDRRTREVEEFYRELKQRGISVRVGMEATGSTCWFDRLMTELGFVLWIGGTQSKFEDNGYGSRRR